MKLSEVPTFPPIQIGTPVLTPKGAGKINYVRQWDGRWIAASVQLDNAVNGTIFRADEITLKPIVSEKS